MPTYVQAQGRDTWHWCRNCSNYPSRPAKTRATRPRGDLCNQCRRNNGSGAVGRRSPGSVVSGIGRSTRRPGPLMLNGNESFSRR
jgi:hypothetical protein